MTSKFYKNTILFLNSIINEDLKEEIISFSLEKRDEVPNELAKNLNLAINKHIKVPGFRPNKTYQAAIPILSKEISTILEDLPDLLSAIISIWAELNTDLQTNVKEYFKKSSKESEENIHKDMLPFDFWEVENLYDTSEKFCENFTDYNIDEVALMICWDTKRVPLTEELMQNIQRQISEENRNRVKGLLWENWLIKLDELPAEAQEWELVEEFINELRFLVDIKIHPKIFDASKLENALADLLSNTASLLNYCNYSGK